jgi:hypothetical protein
MTITQKIKKTVLIALGFGLSTYLMISGFAMLKIEEVKIEKELKGIID